MYKHIKGQVFKYSHLMSLTKDTLPVVYVKTTIKIFPNLTDKLILKFIWK